MRRHRIVIVDDEPGLLHAAQRILGNHHDVACFHGPDEALAAVDALQPELALLDVRMPSMDGFELLGELKQRFADLDVILMTGSVNEIDAKLARAIREKAFFFLQKPFERELLITLVDRWAELRALAEENRGHVQRLERDLHDARAFQRSMLPPPSSEIAGIGLHGRYQPCEEVGGDVLDYAPTGDDRVSVLVADVTGHGVSAALLTGFVKAAFHSAHVDDYAPLSVVQRVQAGVRTTSDDRFITLFCARLSAAAGTLEYVNAGHPEALLRRAGDAIEWLPRTGPLVSPAFPDLTWREAALEWRPGDQLLLHTDGVEEMAGPEGLFGRERLADAVRAGAPDGPALLAALQHELDVFRAGRPPADDCTLLLVEHQGGTTGNTPRRSDRTARRD